MSELRHQIVPRLAGLLGLKPAEVRGTALASFFHLAFVAAVVLIKSASNALVVARFQADALPPLYIATAATKAKWKRLARAVARSSSGFRPSRPARRWALRWSVSDKAPPS